MGFYLVEYLDDSGERKRAEVEAASEEEALEKVLARGGVKSLVKVKRRLKFNLGKGSAYRVPLKYLIPMCRQLSIMFRAGVSVLEMFDILRGSSRDRGLKQLLTEMREEIRSGSSFSSVFEKRRESFGELMVNLVKVGETSGTLDEVFDRLYGYYNRVYELRNKIITMMIYPILVLMVAALVLGIAFFYVVPKFEKLFSGLMDVSELPLITRLVFLTSDFLRAYWPYVLGVGLVLMILGVILLRRTNFRKSFEAFLLKLPLIGDSLRFYYSTIFFSSLSMMLKAAVPILTALKLSALSTDSKLFIDRLDKAAEDLQGGKSLSASLISTGLFEPIVEQFLITGEKSGNLYDMLEQAYVYYNSEIDTLLDRALKLIEPIMIVVLGAFVFFILLALYLPIFILPGKIASK